MVERGAALDAEKVMKEEGEEATIVKGMVVFFRELVPPTLLNALFFYKI